MWFYSTAKPIWCLAATAGAALPLFLPFPSSPCYQHLSSPILQRAPLARKYFLFFFKYRLPFYSFHPSKSRLGGGWEGLGKTGRRRGFGRELACIINIIFSISSGLRPWGCLGNCIHAAIPLQQEPGRKARCNAFPAVCPRFPRPPAVAAEGLFTVLHTCRFRNKERSVKVFCRDSPTLWFFPLRSRLFLVCLLASEITSLSALDDFHNIYCDSGFQRSG